MIQKFSFSNFGLPLTITNEEGDPYEVEFEHRLVCSCVIDNWIALFFVNWQKKYYINIYDFGLNWLNGDKEINIDDCTFDSSYGNFFKLYHLKEKTIILIYFKSYNSNSLKLKIRNINSDYGFSEKLSKELSEFNFKTNVTLNDFVKLNEERVIFVGLSSTSFQKLIILLIDLYNNYNN